MAPVVVGSAFAHHVRSRNGYTDLGNDRGLPRLVDIRGEAVDGPAIAARSSLVPDAIESVRSPLEANTDVKSRPGLLRLVVLGLMTLLSHCCLRAGSP